jgi:hypothetical protein
MSSGTGTVDAAFEMFTCYNDGRSATNRLGISCWALGFHTAGSIANKTYKVTVYNYEWSSTTTALKSTDYSASVT